jgi:hypothetical protein
METKARTGCALKARVLDVQFDRMSVDLQTGAHMIFPQRVTTELKHATGR